MAPLTTLRASLRRPLFGLLVVGGIMTMSPVRAALPTSDLLADPVPLTNDLPVDLDGVLNDSSGDPTAVVGALAGEALGGDVLADTPLGGDLFGGDLFGGLGSVDGLPGLSGLGLNTAGGNAGNGTSFDSAANSSDSGKGVSVGGIHFGVKGQNPLETILGVGCEDTTGRVGTSAPGASTNLPVSLPGGLCPAAELPTSGSTSPPAPGPGSPNSPAVPGKPGTSVLPARLEAPGSTLASSQSVASASPVTAGADPVSLPALVAAPVPHTPLPRTGPESLFQGPAAFGLLGGSAALRALVRRRGRATN